LRIVSLDVSREARGVSVRLGAMQFIRILGHSSEAALRVKASTAPFALAMAVWLGNPCDAATLENRTMLLLPLALPEGASAALIKGTAAFTAIAADKKFSEYASRKSAPDVALRGLRGMEPTAYTRPEIGAFDATPFTAASTLSGMLQSTTVNGHSPS